jgi:hypothetical protein
MSRSLVLLLIALLCASSLTMVVRPSYGAVTANSWVTKAPMPTARSLLGVTVCNNSIYAVGGSNLTATVDAKAQWGEAFSGGVVGANEVYDPITDSWAARAPMPTPRENFAIAVWNNRIFCIGGQTNDGTITGVNEVYDQSSDTWETKTSMPTGESMIQAYTVNDEIYVLGQPQSWVYFPINDSWSSISPITNESATFASAVFNNKIYVFGSSTQIFSPENDSWTVGTSPPDPVIEYEQTSQGTYDINGVAVATLGQICVFSNYNIPMAQISNSNQIYFPENDSWTLGEDLPSWRVGFGAAAFNNTVYLVGGLVYSYPLAITGAIQYYDSNPTGTNEQYIPAENDLVGSNPSFSSLNPSPTSSVPELTYCTLPIVVLFALLTVVTIIFTKWRNHENPHFHLQYRSFELSGRCQYPFTTLIVH